MSQAGEYKASGTARAMVIGEVLHILRPVVYRTYCNMARHRILSC